MNLRRAAARRALLAIIAAAVIATVLLRERILWWTVGILGSLVVWSLAVTWFEWRGMSAVLGLRARWLELPGAEPAGERAIRVHHGMQPIEVHLARRRGELAAVVQTAIGDSPIAFRLFPAEIPPPPVARSGEPGADPPVERMPLIEQRFAGRLRVDASELAAARGLLTPEVTQAILEVMHEVPGAFRGLTYDGERLGVHLGGPLVTDPERAASLARRIWRPLAA